MLGQTCYVCTLCRKAADDYFELAALHAEENAKTFDEVRSMAQHGVARQKARPA